MLGWMADIDTFGSEIDYRIKYKAHSGLEYVVRLVMLLTTFKKKTNSEKGSYT